MNDILEKISKILMESTSSTTGSSELWFGAWSRPNQIYLRNGKILWSTCLEYPTNSMMDEDDVQRARSLGYTIIPW